MYIVSLGGLRYVLGIEYHTVMLYLLFELDELLDTGGRAGGGMVFSPFLEITRLDKEGCSEDGFVEASKKESRVEEDFVLGPEPWERSESSEDFSVLKLAFDRLLRSLKKGIVPTNPLFYVPSCNSPTNGQMVVGSVKGMERLRLRLRHDEGTSAVHVCVCVITRGRYDECCSVEDDYETV